MKLKYHKIRNVDMDICTAEQVVAYNTAYRIYIDSRFNWKADAPRFIMLEAIQYAIDDYVELLKKQGCKYNIDAVQCCLRAGLDSYLFSAKQHILTDYDEVGKAFPAYYL